MLIFWEILGHPYYQYSTKFEDGDILLQSEKQTRAILRIGNRHCSRIVANLPAPIEIGAPYLFYGAALIIENFDIKHPKMKTLLEDLLMMAESYLKTDFRFFSIDISALRHVRKNNNHPNRIGRK